jgi:hypothetical protein
VSVIIRPDFQYGPIAAPIAAGHQADRPVEQLIHRVRQVDGFDSWRTPGHAAGFGHSESAVGTPSLCPPWLLMVFAPDAGTYTAAMAMGKRTSEQVLMWISTTDLPARRAIHSMCG